MLTGRVLGGGDPYTYRSSVAPRRGLFLLPVSAEVRAEPPRHPLALFAGPAPVAQWIEQPPSKRLAAGSIPAGGAPQSRQLAAPQLPAAPQLTRVGRLGVAPAGVRTYWGAASPAEAGCSFVRCISQSVSVRISA